MSMFAALVKKVNKVRLNIILEVSLGTRSA